MHKKARLIQTSRVFRESLQHRMMCDPLAETQIAVEVGPSMIDHTEEDHDLNGEETVRFFFFIF